VRLAQLLDAPVEVADDRIAIDDDFAIEPQDHAKHTVCAGMLRTHVEHHLALGIRELNLVGDGVGSGGGHFLNQVDGVRSPLGIGGCAHC
jgi:hypothetical protein